MKALVNLFELECLNSKLTDKFNFETKLLGICSDKGEIFDLSTKQFIKSKPEYYISDYCNWIYSETEALKYYDDVVNFIELIFPLVETRVMVLKWIACCLNGENNGKRALILTDNTNGDNGKSTFINLVNRTFDVYKIEGLRYLTANRSSKHFKDENSHASGLKQLKNKRLMYVDETQQEYTINTGEFNNYVSEKTFIEGRCFGSNKYFSFFNTTSVLIACNENKFPKFSAHDETITKRLLVVKMLTTFVNDVNDVTNSNILYPKQKIDGFSKQFSLWMSAFFKLLMEYYDVNGFRSVCDVPYIVNQYTEELVNKRLSQNINDGDNFDRLQDFIRTKLVYVENKLESCTISDLKGPLKEFGLENLMKGKNWVAELRAMLNLCGLKVKEQVKLTVNKTIDRRKNKVMNMKLI